jgi:hypothetical protein
MKDLQGLACENVHFWMKLLGCVVETLPLAIVNGRRICKPQMYCRPRETTHARDTEHGFDVSLLVCTVLYKDDPLHYYLQDSASFAPNFSIVSDVVADRNRKFVYAEASMTMNGRAPGRRQCLGIRNFGKGCELMIFIAFEAVLEDETGCHHVICALSVSM